MASLADIVTRADTTGTGGSPVPVHAVDFVTPLTPTTEDLAKAASDAAIAEAEARAADPGSLNPETSATSIVPVGGPVVDFAAVAAVYEALNASEAPEDDSEAEVEVEAPVAPDAPEAEIAGEAGDQSDAAASEDVTGDDQPTE